MSTYYGLTSTLTTGIFYWISAFTNLLELSFRSHFTGSELFVHKFIEAELSFTYLQGSELSFTHLLELSFRTHFLQY